tara:strand:+ start:1453 stop:2469 length:1017 start_codon:yes stop_codon:yes gene_type:complete
MTVHRRSAVFEAVLVYMDEPQLVTLVAQKTRIVAVAIPYDNVNSAMFLAVSVAQKDWEKYLDGTVDLRYLFTVPTVRTTYYFDLCLMKNSKLMMTPWEGDIEERYLPAPRFFSSNHTESYLADDRATDPEHLVIDGEWELTDFGQFQQKFADIYAFVISSQNWQDESTPYDVRRAIQLAFLNRPFQGGFSYVHLFRDLAENIPRSDKLNLSKIQYASPGSVEIKGKAEIFTEMHEIIQNFLSNKDALRKDYNSFHKFLSERNYLKMSGDAYGQGDAATSYIHQLSRNLAEKMLAPDYDVVRNLSSNNALVCAKIVLAFYRRLSDASMYFAQGRVTYPD